MWTAKVFFRQHSNVKRSLVIVFYRDITQRIKAYRHVDMDSYEYRGKRIRFVDLFSFLFRTSKNNREEKERKYDDCQKTIETTGIECIKIDE